VAAPPSLPTLLDELMPLHDHATMHGRAVAAPVATVARAIESTTLDEARVARLLLGVRTLGRSLRGPSIAISEAGDGEHGFLQVGRSASEVVVGFAGRPWPGGEPLEPFADAAAWRAFVPTDSVKVAMSVRCGTASYGTLLLTETRILCGPMAGQAFGRYWRIVRPGSDLVRRSLLRAIARTAGRDA
jgi:hypothetical protein